MHFEEEFSDIDFTRDPPAGGEYERCVFRDCRLNAADLSNAVLTECEFDNCDLSMAKTANTDLVASLIKRSDSRLQPSTKNSIWNCL